MTINDDLKKEVADLSKKLKAYTLQLTIINKSIRRYISILILSIVLAPVYAVLYFVKDPKFHFVDSQIYVVPIIIILILYIVWHVRTKEQNYKMLYSEASIILEILANKTEWTSLRKRYILRTKNFPETLIMDKFLIETESRFAPSRHIISYYNLVMNLSLLSVVFLFIFEIWMVVDVCL